jgi:hypothetical protein
MGSGESSKKAEAKEMAARKALVNLGVYGWFRTLVAMWSQRRFPVSHYCLSLRTYILNEYIYFLEILTLTTSFKRDTIQPHSGTSVIINQNLEGRRMPSATRSTHR